ncbi:hypothetical protein, partial [Fulvivirga kasyanovii]
FSFPKGSEKDNFTTYRVSVLTNDSKESKIKRKYVDKSSSESSLELIVNKEGLPDNGLLRIYCNIESFNFKTLKVSMTTDNSVQTYFSFNLPEIFNYSAPDLEMTQMDQQTKGFNLKHFTYQSTPIVDYNVTSNSFKWKVESNPPAALVMESLSIDLPVDFGTSIEQIMKYSK